MRRSYVRLSEMQNLGKKYVLKIRTQFLMIKIVFFCHQNFDLKNEYLAKDFINIIRILNNNFDLILSSCEVILV